LIELEEYPMKPDGKHSTPSQALAELRAQHDALREMMDRCEGLARGLDAGRGDPTQLTRELTRLRLAFEAHNKYEEQLLRPLLLDADAFAEVRIDRMIEDHDGEHRTMTAQLDTTETSALRDVVESLRAHLEAEERYMLSPRVLRDDIVVLESGG
jgi:iron-sulfur cluster repair protein YtfE (RIC family)